MHPGRRIERVAWTKKTIDSKRTCGSLIIELLTSEAANSLMDSGLVMKADIKTCEFFDRACRALQQRRKTRQ